MQDEKEGNRYISLRQASRFCDYSQDYLSLRARKGKLKAIKIGRKWITTKEWLNEYIGKVNEYKNKHIKKNNNVETVKVKIAPIEKQNNFINKQPVLPHAIIAVALLVFILFFGGVVLGYNSNSILKSLSPIAKSTIISVKMGANITTEAILENQTFQSISKSTKSNLNYVYKGVEYLSKSESSKYILNNIKNINEKVVMGANISYDQFSETEFSGYIKGAFHYIKEKLVLGINIISDKFFNNRSLVNIETLGYIKNSIIKNVNNLKIFIKEVVDRNFYPIQESFRHFISYCKNVLSWEAEIFR